MCEECVQEKEHKNNLGKDARIKSKATLKVIYSYVCGPLRVDSIGGNKYFVTFIDNYNIKLWTCLIKKKSGVIDVFTKFKAIMER